MPSLFITLIRLVRYKQNINLNQKEKMNTDKSNKDLSKSNTTLADQMSQTIVDIKMYNPKAPSNSEHVGSGFLWDKTSIYMRTHVIKEALNKRRVVLDTTPFTTNVVPRLKPDSNVFQVNILEKSQYAQPIAMDLQ